MSTVSAIMYKFLGSVIVLSSIATMAQAKNTLVYCSEGSPAGFDSPQYSALTDFDASANNVFDGLMRFPRGETKAVPALAERYEVSADGLTYLFHLRKGVKWHTTPFFKPTRDFNADDVVFTFERFARKNIPFHKAYPVAFPYYVDMGLDTIIKSVEKIDENTVKFTLNNEDASFIQTMAMPILAINSKEYADKLLVEGQPERFNQLPVGTGPFIFVRYQKDDFIRYKANKDYWNKEDMPLVDNLVFAITKDASVRYQRLKAGECDIMSYPLPADVAEMRKDSSLIVKSHPGFNIGFIAYNTEKPPLDKVEVRQALDYAINKREIIEAVYAGEGQLIANPMPETQWSYNTRIQSRPYDVNKAKALLAKAGYPDGFEVNLWALPVQRPYNPNGRLMAEMLQADWAKIGVTVTITTLEWGEYLKRARTGEHQIAMSGWTGDNGDPDNWLGNLFACHAVGGSNYSRFCYKPFQELLDRAKRLTQVDDRTRLYEQAQEIFFEQTPGSMIGTSVVTVPMRSGVSGFKISPLGAFQFTGVSVK